MKRTINLQQFAAPANLTDDAAINIKAREIDFVTSFNKNITALTDVLGISRMIKKANGSALYTKTATGTLEDGAVAEGDEIPLSKYAVSETVYDTITINKYKKGVSIEAIADKGYEAAVDMTDEEFKADLQNQVKSKFYTQLNAGTLTSTEATFQMGVAMAVGKIKNKFQEMGRTATGTAVFVNTLDAYKYIGAADITVQTAFGMDYVQNFLGANIVFLTNEIASGTVVATPLNNIVAYYVDPSDSEFVKAGLSYTTDNETGLIGFHLQGDYDRAVSSEYAIMGVRLFAEYLDAIAKITVTGA
jgi:hypothetical protein